MHKRRKKGMALPSKRTFSFNQNDLNKGNFYSNDKHNETYFEQNNTGQSPSTIFGEGAGNIVKGERRSSACSMTLPLRSERRRRNSSQSGGLTSNTIHGLLHQPDIENHFAVILGAPAVGKTGRNEITAFLQIHKIYVTMSLSVTVGGNPK